MSTSLRLNALRLRRKYSISNCLGAVEKLSTVATETPEGKLVQMVSIDTMLFVATNVGFGVGVAARERVDNMKVDVVLDAVVTAGTAEAMCVIVDKVLTLLELDTLLTTF